MTHTITIGGQALPAAFTMGTWKRMEEDWGVSFSAISDICREDLPVADKARTVTFLLAALTQEPGMTVADAVARVGALQPAEMTMALAEAAACIHAAMETRIMAGEDKDDYDPVLAELDAKHGDQKDKLTWRKVTGWGLVAGISLAEQEELTPGMVCDLFAVRMEYDDQQHGVRRKKKEDDWALMGLGNTADPDGSDDHG